MKKTLLATAIAGALGASAAAQAATVYDQDGTRLDLYGRIALGISGGGEQADTGDDNAKQGGTEFRDVYSRFGLRGTQQINSDLTAFGNFELRPQLDEVNRGGQQVRNSYLGLRSNSFGTIQAGNFDSFYLETVSAPFDVYIDRGLEFTGGSHRARGDSIGYITPNLAGFQVYLMGKHYSGNGLEYAEGESRSSEINAAGGAVYETGPLRLALGFAQDKNDPAVAQKDGAGTGENIYGGSASYEFMPGFSGRLGYESHEDQERRIGVGMSYAVADWAFNLDYYNIRADGENKEALQSEDADTTRHSWAAGAYYKVSSNFDVFAEVHEADQGTIFDRDTTGSELGGNLRDTRDSVYWLTGVRYHF